MTTFNEKTKRNISIAPRELRKFHDLHILDVATGVEHILLFAISKQNIYTSLDISSSDPNENNSVKESPPKIRKTSVSGIAAPIPRKNSNPSAEVASKEIVPEARIPILNKQTLESIYTDTQQPVKESEKESKKVPEKNPEQISETKPVDKPEAKKEPKPIPKLESKEEPSPAPVPVPESKPIQPDVVVKVLANSREPSIDKESTQVTRVESESLKEFEKLEMENSVGTAVAHVGDSIKSDVMSMVNTGKEQINEVKNDAVKMVTGIPQHMTDFTKTTIVPKIDDQIKHVNETKNEILDGIFDEVKQSKQFLKQSIAKKLSIDGSETGKSDDTGENGSMRPVEKTKEFLHENMNEMEHLLRSDKIKHELEKDERIEVLVDAGPQSESTVVEDRVKFIDNGVDVSNTSDIIQSMKEEIKEMDAEADDQVMEIKEKTQSNFLGEKLGVSKEAFVDTMTKTKNGKCCILSVIACSLFLRIQIPNKRCRM